MSTHSESPEPYAALPAPSKHHGSGRHWTDEETAVLEKHWEEYREAGDTDEDISPVENPIFAILTKIHL